MIDVKFKNTLPKFEDSFNCNKCGQLTHAFNHYRMIYFEYCNGKSKSFLKSCCPHNQKTEHMHWLCKTCGATWNSACGNNETLLESKEALSKNIMSELAWCIRNCSGELKNKLEGIAATLLIQFE